TSSCWFEISCEPAARARTAPCLCRRLAQRPETADGFRIFFFSARPSWYKGGVSHLAEASMQFDIAPYSLPAGQLPRSTPSLASDLLRQILDVQRQQLDLMKANQNALTAMAEAQSQARKRSWFDRWQDEFPDLPENCRRVMPMLERAYLN